MDYYPDVSLQHTVDSIRAVNEWDDPTRDPEKENLQLKTHPSLRGAGVIMRQDLDKNYAKIRKMKAHKVIMHSP